jgi:hypothetical protein
MLVGQIHASLFETALSWAGRGILGTVGLGPAAWLVRGGVRDVQILLAVATASVVVLVGIAHRIASGPR